MEQDIRTKPQLTHEDVFKLNFLRNPRGYFFRRHFRQGLRSHIMEVIAKDDMDKEKHGVNQEGVKRFPSAKPLKMLRIFRTKFTRIEMALKEIQKVKILENHLGTQYYARSLEFLAHYRISDKWEILLCGLQEYVHGLLIQPWGILQAEYLMKSLQEQGILNGPLYPINSEDYINLIQKNAQTFLNKIKKMIQSTGYIPDLAGEGNLILTGNGYIKLVDINNMSKISYDSNIHIDNKGYPVTDKSVEALYLIEKSLSTIPVDMNHPLYRTYLDPKRKLEVKAIEKVFFSKT